MKFCTKCGKQLSDDAKFCSGCGNRVNYAPPSQQGGSVQPVIRPANKGAANSRTAFSAAAGQQPTVSRQSANQQQAPSGAGTIIADGSGKRVSAAARPQTAPKSTPSFYLIDFFKNFAHQKNIGVIVYMVLNVLLIVLLFGGFVNWINAVVGIVCYLISITIALSPIGEWMVRKQTGCLKVTDPTIINRFEPLFREVYLRAKKMNPELPNDIKFFMSADAAPNAFACGRKTVCVTQGLLSMPDDEIKAILAHEFGHLAHKDTDILLMITSGNTIITWIILINKVIATFTMSMVAIFSRNVLFKIIMLLVAKITDIIATYVFMRLWSYLGILCCNHSGRKHEYEADEYAMNCGYGAELCSGLTRLEGGTVVKANAGLWATLTADHPDTHDRIERLRSLGVQF